MDWYILPGAFALLLAAGGVATLRTGFVLPWLRRRVQRVAVYGWAQLIMAGSFALQSAAGFAGDPAARSAVGIVALLALLAALVLLLVAQLAPGRD
ncbi:hypothetical protein [Streptomyces sp. NPDC058486]|uniref:hypothetical protein n=1 Tax=unclassified Streptomyces TaxID=2593676 RepID=UPI003666C38A